MGKVVDHGNYIPVPIPAGALKVGSGEVLDKVYVLDGNSCARMPSAIVVDSDASVRLCIIAFPGATADIGLDVFIRGTHSSVSLSGIFAESGSDSISLRVNMHHLSPDCTSDQLFNTLASGSSRFDFHGKIIVAPEGQKTESFQTNRNILLSDEAQVLTKPRLEIYADDVKCSHGATIGRLNEEEQFYMRSRGIPENDARVLQMLSFISPVLSHLPSGSGISERLEQAIRSL